MSIPAETPADVTSGSNTTGNQKQIERRRILKGGVD